MIPGPYPDLITAWQVAGDLRARQPQEIFIAVAGRIFAEGPQKPTEGASLKQESSTQ